MGSIKKFFTNKTTITFVGVILGIIVLVGGYFFRVNKSLSDVKIPIAKRTLNATEVITSADIEYVKVNPEFYGTLNVYTQYEINDLVNKYVSVGTSIPKGSVFFKSSVVAKKELPNSIFDNIDDKNTIYQLGVDEKTTIADSIRPGDRIDLILTTTVNGKLVNQALISNIEVLVVRDKQGNNVFDEGTPTKSSWLLFSVPICTYRLLKYVEFQSNLKIYPLPSNNYKLNPGETEFGSSELTKLITDNTMRMKGELDEYECNF